jgi:hypothetical protein
MVIFVLLGPGVSIAWCDLYPFKIFSRLRKRFLPQVIIEGILKELRAKKQ